MIKSKKALTILLLNSMVNLPYIDSDMLSDNGSARYLPKRSYKNKLKSKINKKYGKK